MTKKERHHLILKLIEENDIETQEELCERLKNMGIDVTQSTVSRDVTELRLSKVPTGTGTQKYSAICNDDGHLAGKYIRVMRDGFLSMDSAQNILVVRTVAGMAMAVAAALDAMHMREVVGSIAGDDTIMMAIRTTEETKIVMDRIREII
ncbi:MAG: arginine repressor [Lachnospiraceae bacterium]|nr:arginine repressor [Candidatus Colinaster equi]